MSEKVIPDGNFTFEEFLVSQDHPDLAKKMSLNDAEKAIIRLQVECIEQPLRNKFGRMQILSGKRSFVLNKAIGGEKNSDHLTCNAVDTLFLDVKDTFEVFKYIYKMNMPYRQIIYYPERKTPFIHKSINIPGKSYKHEAFINRVGRYIPYKGEDKI